MQAECTRYLAYVNERGSCVKLGVFTPASIPAPVNGRRVTFLAGHRSKFKL